MWEEAKKKGDAEIERMIDNALDRTTVTVVFIGTQTAGRKYTNYETRQSIARRNGFLGIQIDHLKDRSGNTDTVGAIPALLTQHEAPVYKCVDGDKLAARIEQAAWKAETIWVFFRVVSVTSGHAIFGRDQCRSRAARSSETADAARDLHPLHARGAARRTTWRVLGLPCGRGGGARPHPA